MNKFDKKAQTWDKNQNRVNLAKTVANNIKKNIHLNLDMRGLDFGCGTGLISLYLAPYLKQITLVDNSPGMLEVLKKKIMAENISNLKVMSYDFDISSAAKEQFDLIFSSMALHHINNITDLFSTFFDLIEPGGTLAIADLDKEDGTFHDSASIEHQGFIRDDLKKIAIQTGFADITFKDIYTFQKPNSRGQKSFPIFLMIAKKYLTKN